MLHYLLHGAIDVKMGFKLALSHILWYLLRFDMYLPRDCLFARSSECICLSHLLPRAYACSSFRICSECVRNTHSPAQRRVKLSKIQTVWPTLVNNEEKKVKVSRQIVEQPTGRKLLKAGSGVFRRQMPANASTPSARAFVTCRFPRLPAKMPSSEPAQGVVERVQNFVAENKKAVLIGAAVAAVAIGGAAYYASTSGSDEGKGSRKKDKKKAKGSKKKKGVSDADGPILEEVTPQQSKVSSEGLLKLCLGRACNFDKAFVHR